MTQVLAKVKRQAKKHGGDLTVDLPFLSFEVAPEDIEPRVGRELPIRHADKRALSCKECCDNSIAHSLASFQEIRSVLLEKQVERSSLSDGSIFLLAEYFAEGIRQFLTATEGHANSISFTSGEAYLGPQVRERCFRGLEWLRCHIHRCLFRLSKFASAENPRVAACLRSEAE